MYLTFLPEQVYANSLLTMYVGLVLTMTLELRTAY